MAKKSAPTNELERARKIGERDDTIVVELTPAQVDEKKTEVMDLLGRRDNLLAAVKSIKADYKAKVERVDTDLALARRAAQTGRVELDVHIEEWLTAGNEVIKVRTDTGEQLGRRTATAAELQETMFDGPPPSRRGGEDGFPDSEEAFGSPS